MGLLNLTDTNQTVACMRFIQRLRIILIIPMAVLELCALALGWLLAFAHEPTACRWVMFYMRVLPNGEWYYASNAQAHSQKGRERGPDNTQD